MRGRFQDQGGLFSYLSPEARVARSHWDFMGLAADRDW